MVETRTYVDYEDDVYVKELAVHDMSWWHLLAEVSPSALKVEIRDRDGDKWIIFGILKGQQLTEYMVSEDDAKNLVKWLHENFLEKDGLREA